VDDVPYVDTLVREYLLYRGCSGALAAFDAERGEGRAFDRADRVAELIFGRHVPRLDAVGLSRTLGLLRDRYFSRLDASFAPATAELETSIARLFVVTAVKARRKDKIAELFEAEGERLVAAGGDHEWHRWFAVPYVKRPGSDPKFAPYFEDKWADAVVASARNFLSTTFAAAPEPAMLKFGAARRERNRLAERVAALERELAGMREQKRSLVSKSVSASAPARVDASRKEGKKKNDVRVSASSFASDESASAYELPPPPPASVPSRDALRTNGLTFKRQDAFSFHAPGPGDARALRPKRRARRQRRRRRRGPGLVRRRARRRRRRRRLSSRRRRHRVSARRRTRCRCVGVGRGILRREKKMATATFPPAAFCTSARATRRFAPGTSASAPWSPTPPGTSLSRTARTCGVRRAGAGSHGARRRGTRGRCSSLKRRAKRRRSRGGRLSAAWRFGTRLRLRRRRLCLSVRRRRARTSSRSTTTARCSRAACADGEIRLFDVNAGRLVAKWRAHPKGHAATSVAFSNDNERVFGVGTDGVVAEWSLRRLRGLLSTVDVRETCGVDTRTRLALDPSGRAVALTSAVANGAVAAPERMRNDENAFSGTNEEVDGTPTGGLPRRGGFAVSLPGSGAAARCVDWHPTKSAVLAGCVDGACMLTTLEMSS
jgi:hypothetical protein